MVRENKKNSSKRINIVSFNSLDLTLIGSFQFLSGLKQQLKRKFVGKEAAKTFGNEELNATQF